MLKMIDIPLGLRQKLETGDCVLFIGAGIGIHLINPNGESAPTAATLAQELAEKFSINAGDTDDLAKIAAIVELRVGRTELETFLRNRLANLKPDRILQWLVSRPWKAIFTTNYDHGIQRAYELLSNPVQQPVTITCASEVVDCDPRFEVPIYHLHGTLFGAAKGQIVVTEGDYIRFREPRRMLFELLKIRFAMSPLLYIGYANHDINWKTVLDEAMIEFYPSPLPHSFRIAPHTNPLDDELLRARGIETINGSLEEFVRSAELILPQPPPDFDRLKQMQSSVPSDLQPAFEINPVATVRLVSSWDYVNQATFSEEPNLTQFLTGNRPNWALVGSRQIFERDSEEEIFDTLLENATSPTRRCAVNVLLGPAGYGVTTLMMTLAARLVKDQAGAVLMLKAGQSVLEGDVEYACSLFERNVFFFVDNAAKESEALATIITRLRETGRTAIFLLGARLNEWRQSRPRFSGNEFALDPLSDPEIDRLLDYLYDHGELNQLEHLSRDLQFNVIKEKHRKELLIVMREATEGRSFDAILEGEFRGIAGATARKAYLTVCCFYQHGAYIRAELLAQLLGISHTQLYDSDIANGMEGVVVYDPIDGDGHYVARARHRTIAAVVWERCGDLSEKERLLQASLSALNLNYKADKDAFEDFIRSDRLIDSISTFEGRMNFFEKACRKDPQSPYVRQHYARMLLRGEKYNSALDQINHAFDLNPRIRVLHHTRGLIFASLALNNESPELARRWLAQGEESFSRGLSLAPNDEYCYQGLAKLYFDWAKCAPTAAEQAEYISKAEETINKGLKVVHIRDGLWIVSSDIQKWLGNEPSSLDALEQAVHDNPGSIIARYLLGRAYRKMHQPDKALLILEPIIKNHYDEFRAFVEYAVALIHAGHSYKEAIAVLNLSHLYGMSDPRYIATLGGMLFMDGNFTEASRVFDESSRHNFASSEVHTIEFRPPDPSNLRKHLRVEGKIISVKAGYAFIETANYPPFRCPASKFHGLLMRQGLKVTFEPAFNAKGYIADKPEAIA